MKKNSILSYLKKYQVLIVLLSLSMGVLFYLTLQGKQSYTASAMIRYSNQQATEGLAPDGSEIDVSEIYSSQVMIKVMDRMGLDQGNYNLDDLRSRVRVKEVISDEMQAVQEAKNELGEVIADKPTEYLVSFTATRKDSDKAGQFARELMDNMLDIYITNYGEQHINSSAVVNDVSKLYEHDYDYLEMAEILEKSVQNAIDKISSKTESRYDFRSAATGYSFDDLYYEFRLLTDNEIPSLYAFILNNKITKNRDVLIAKYENRVKDFYLENNAGEAEIRGIEGVIESYVQMMRESGNTEISFEYILEDVHDNFEPTGDEMAPKKRVDQTTQYDLLLKDYVKDRSDYEEALIETAFCQYILDVYSGKTAFTDGTETTRELEAPVDGSPLSPVEAESASSEAIMEAEEIVQELVTKVNNLYNVLALTNDEYNEYGGAANISLMSNIVVTENVQLLLYTGIAVILAAIVLSVLAVLAGRVEDISEYYMFRDHKFGFPNRAALDKYMNGRKTELLDKSFCCIVFQMKDVQKKNSVYGRQETDDMMKKCLDIIRQTFPEKSEGFLAINGLGQFVCFMPGLAVEHIETYLKEIRERAEEYNKAKDCKIEYVVRFSQAEADQTYKIHDLLVHAMRKEPYYGEITDNN